MLLSGLHIQSQPPVGRLCFLLLILFACQSRPDTAYFDLRHDYQRIITANVFSAEILWRLGQSSRQRVIAVPAMIDDPRYSDFTYRWPKTLPRFYRSLEEILVLKPDLVILAAFNALAFKEILIQAGIDFLQLQQFSGFQSYRNNLRRIAAAVQAEEAGERLIARFERRLSSVLQKARTMPRLTIMSYMYGYTAGANTTFHAIVEAAGLKNLSAAKGIQNFKRLSVEQLLLWKADSIVISCGQLDCAQARKKFPANLGLKKLNSQIIALPENLLGNVNENMLLLAESLQEHFLKK